MGGMTIGTKAQAEALADIPRVRIAVSEKRIPAPVVGDRIELPPCENRPGEYADYAKEQAEGKRQWPCPRVDLELENLEALDLFFIATNEDAGRFASVMTEALLGPFTRRERLAVLNRVLRALGDDKVIQARQALHDQAVERSRQTSRARRGR